jgi:hypothetical protein
MTSPIATLEVLRRQSLEAEELHERSRHLLVDAVRTGVRAGLSQREIAAAIHRSQPEVSRLLRFHGATELGRTLSRNRAQVIRLARAHGAENLRVFGSVARAADTAESDIDLLADIRAGTTLFDIARLERDLGELLGVGVDVVPADSLRGHLADEVLREAVPL